MNVSTIAAAARLRPCLRSDPLGRNRWDRARGQLRAAGRGGSAVRSGCHVRSRSSGPASSGAASPLQRGRGRPGRLRACWRSEGSFWSSTICPPPAAVLQSVSGARRNRELRRAGITEARQQPGLHDPVSTAAGGRGSCAIAWRVLRLPPVRRPIHDPGRSRGGSADSPRVLRHGPASRAAGLHEAFRLSRRGAADFVGAASEPPGSVRTVVLIRFSVFT